MLKIEGDSYVVKDMTGKEIRMHVDKTTKTGRRWPESKNRSRLTEKGHVLSITKPLVADGGHQVPRLSKVTC